MIDPVTELRALLMQFETSGLKDLLIRSKEWTLFMAQPDGAANPLQFASIAAPMSDTVVVAINAPHLGLFVPTCAEGDLVSAGQVIAVIDVLGRKTDVISTSTGHVTSINFAANDLVEYGEVLVDIAAA